MSMLHFTKDSIDDLFRSCDLDRSGFIERDEFDSVCLGLGLGALDTESLFIEIDKDGDGRLSKEDFHRTFDSGVDFDKSFDSVSTEDTEVRRMPWKFSWNRLVELTSPEFKKLSINR